MLAPQMVSHNHALIRLGRARSEIDPTLGIPPHRLVAERTQNGPFGSACVVAHGLCGGKNRSVRGECMTAVTCKKTWAIGEAMGFAAPSVATDPIVLPIFG